MASLLGTGIPIGSVLGSRFVSIRPELPVGQLPSTFAEWGATQIGVVDAGGHLLGKVWRDDFAPRRSLGSVAGDRLDRAVFVLEGAPLMRAVEAAVHDHARMVFVVNTERVLVGTLTDLELLRWVSGERRRVSERTPA
jgi:CBS-domain-containing membrane protein